MVVEIALFITTGHFHMQMYQALADKTVLKLPAGLDVLLLIFVNTLVCSQRALQFWLSPLSLSLF